MNNFEFEHKGQKLWYSRSLACNLVIFRKSNDGLYVLANKRGQGCEFNKGLWNVPGGFIDFDEDAKDCAIRETYEECGVKIPRDRIVFFNLDTCPRGKRQTMVASHYAIFTEEETRDWNLTNEHSENDEVERIEWIHLDELDQIMWTNNQRNMIMNIYYTLERNQKI